jgi:hypothetical protein
MTRSILRYVWAMPATAAGILLAGWACARGATAVVTDGVLEVAGGHLGQTISRLPRCLQFSAITLGHVVIGVSHDMLAQCRVHERVHVRQYERWGILFFPLYFGSSLLQLLRGRSPYWHNYFERQAYRAERGTERVRSSRGGRQAAGG